MSIEDRVLWDERWREGTHGSREVAPFLVSLDALLPRSGAAIDVAGGRGWNALWLARRGLDVTLVDVSPVALAIARERAAADGLALEAVELDLEADPLPAGPFRLVTCFHFLRRPLFPDLAAALAPGGLLVVEIMTRRNLERHASPSERFLLEEGELPGLARGLEVLSCDEGWRDSGRHEARLVARRPRR
jgi:SAM-dependent methyltransferase